MGSRSHIDRGVATTSDQWPFGAVGLKIKDRKVGTGAEAEAGKIIGVQYVGTLLDGTEFDSSMGTPLRIPLGGGYIIQGWEEGIVGMKVGGKRHLEIPPELAYGEEGFPPEIPPNATLRFEVELVEVSEPKEGEWP